MNVLAHRRAMKRHTQHVEQADLTPVANANRGGIDLVVTFADGAIQRIFIPRHHINAFSHLVRVASAGLS